MRKLAENCRRADATEEWWEKECRRLDAGEGEGKEANECRRADASEDEEKEEKKDEEGQGEEEEDQEESGEEKETASEVEESETEKGATECGRADAGEASEVSGQLATLPFEASPTNFVFGYSQELHQAFRYTVNNRGNASIRTIRMYSRRPGPRTTISYVQSLMTRL